MRVKIDAIFILRMFCLVAPLIAFQNCSPPGDPTGSVSVFSNSHGDGVPIGPSPNHSPSPSGSPPSSPTSTPAGPSATPTPTPTSTPKISLHVVERVPILNFINPWTLVSFTSSNGISSQGLPNAGVTVFEGPDHAALEFDLIVDPAAFSSGIASGTATLVTQHLPSCNNDPTPQQWTWNFQISQTSGDCYQVRLSTVGTLYAACGLIYFSPFTHDASYCR